MPTLHENKTTWDGAYAWEHRGDEWSAAWGGPRMQWNGAILPRIHGFVRNPDFMRQAAILAQLAATLEPGADSR